MLGSSSTAAATLSTNTSSATSTTPTRPGRLRGLSYLRNYTHSHLHSNSFSSSTTNPASATIRSTAPTPLTRSTSTPSSPALLHSLPPGSRPADAQNIAPASQRPDKPCAATSAWPPTTGDQAASSRLASESQSTAPSAPTAESSPASTMVRNRDPSAITHPSTLAQEVTGDDSSEAAAAGAAATPTPTPTPSSADNRKDVSPSIRLIPHHEPRATRPSLSFPIVSRTLSTSSSIVRVGRYSERDTNAAEALNNPLSSAPVGFKSKVVSRRHCEFWCNNSQWFVKDVKSSSGTFLNHVRLSSPGVESRPFPVNDGDIVQLGIDFKGGEEVIFRCVKIRIECNRGWQKSLNAYNTSTHKRLQNLAKSASKDADAQSTHSSECSICLNPVAPCQALFVAPCSHVWHYKCVRTLLNPSWPSFQCPNCRAYSDLDADVEPAEVEEGNEEDSENALQASSEDHSSDGDDAAHGLDASVSSIDVHPDDLTSAMRSASLQSADSTMPVVGQSSGLGQSAFSAASLSQPVPITATTNARISPPDPIGGARSTTPTSTLQFAMAAGSLMSEGPLTPRNDAGPFVFDGAAGRRRPIDDLVRDTVEEEPEEEDAAARNEDTS